MEAWVVGGVVDEVCCVYGHRSSKIGTQFVLSATSVLSLLPE